MRFPQRLFGRSECKQAGRQGREGVLTSALRQRLREQPGRRESGIEWQVDVAVGIEVARVHRLDLSETVHALSAVLVGNQRRPVSSRRMVSTREPCTRVQGRS